MLAMTSLNLSLPTESYSPFHGFAAVQTINMTIIGMISFVVLILVENRGAIFNPKFIIFVPAIVLLSFLIQYTADPRQLQQYSLTFALFFFLPGNIPIIEAPYFTTIYLLPLLVYGGILGLLASYLLPDIPPKSENTQNAVLSDFAFRSFLVIFIGPALLTIPIGFVIGGLQSITHQFFPFYGEGTAGSILVVSVLLSMYICARLITSWDRINLNLVTNAKFSEIVSFLTELIAAYACIIAAFSLMGGLLTDGTPPPLILPIEYTLLTILVTIPFGLLISRNRIFPRLASQESSG